MSFATEETHTDGSPVLRIVNTNHGQEISSQAFLGPHFIKIHIGDELIQMNKNDTNVELDWMIVPENEGENVEVTLDLDGYHGQVTFMVDYNAQHVVIQSVSAPSDFKVILKHFDFPKRMATYQVTVSD